MKLKYIKNVVTLKLHEELCAGCGTCAEVCPRGVLEIRKGRAAIADRDACIECGACVGNCPYQALEVHKGVGCAAAILHGLLTGSEPSCG